MVTNSKKIRALLKEFPRTYSEELGIDLKSKCPKELFKWFLASILFGTRISETIAKNTYKTFEKYNLLKPEGIIEAGWSFLVNPIMREGGYVRYDEKTSTQLLRNCKTLLEEYDGNLNKLHEKAKNSKDLEEKLKEFYGVGPVTTDIFLRELRCVWRKADPKLSKFVGLAAKNLRINLMKFDKKTERFVHLESSLLRLGKDYCNKGKCNVCNLKALCIKKKKGF